MGGVEIFIHWSWLIISVLVLFGLQARLTLDHPDLADGSAFVLALLGTIIFFGSVLLHELAHALVARARGIESKRITLYLFGGATEADASSKSPNDELVIAIAGPLTSVTLGVFLAGLAALLSPTQSDALVDLIAYLAGINVLLAVFNMTPGLPLDGGRVFRSIVWKMTGDFAKATRWATTAGVIVGYGLAAVGVMYLWQGSVGGLWLVAIGWMISQSARRTGQDEALRELLRERVAGDVMTSPVITVAATATVDEAVRNYFAHHDLTVLPVVDGTRVIGMLGLSEIRRVGPERRAVATAAELARDLDPALIATPETPVKEVLDALSTDKARVLVLDREVLVGIISPRDILRWSALAPLLAQPTATER